MSAKSHRNASDAPTKQSNRKRTRVNWHEAASCALQIELRDYSGFLEYMEEYILGKNNYRIDLLVIKKLTDQVISKSIALIFKTFNLFEIKGVGSSVGVDTYYKTIGYVGLLINQTGEKNRYASLDVSLSFLSCYYPRKLMKHLRVERKLCIEKITPGIYYINKEIFSTQIIVTKEPPPEDNLYLHFLTDRVWGGALAERLTDDYKEHQDQVIYRRYLHQIMTANTKEKAEYYQPKIDYLKSLLIQNNIPFNLEEDRI